MRPSLTALSMVVCGLVCLAGCGDDEPELVERECLTEPNLQSLEMNYFQPSCATPACHSTADHAGGLVLTFGSTASETIGVHAQNGGAIARGKILVVPGDPEASFLLQKVLEPGTGEGNLMPIGLDEPTEHDLACSIAALEMWIAEGAEVTP